MSSKNNKNGDPGRSTRDEDILGGPDQGGREDVLSPPGLDPHPGKDILGGPDGVGPEDVLTPLGEPAMPAPHDVLGGPDPDGTEDILRPDGED